MTQALRLSWAIGVLCAANVAAQDSIDFVGSPLSGCAPLRVRFTNLSRFEVKRWKWDFGDGETNRDRSPAHTFDEPGTYTVTLRAGNLSAVRVNYVTVLPTPEAGFDADVRAGCGPVTVQFENESTGAQTYFWDFGDGNTSLLPAPRHTYTENGEFTVKLTAAVGDCVDTETRGDFVRVGEKPDAPDRIEYPSRALFGEVITIQWPRSNGAERYRVEGRVDDDDWDSVCTVDDSSDVDEYSCTFQLNRVGAWSFRVQAEGLCGDSDPTVGPPLVVGTTEFIAFWPLDDCVAADIVGGNDAQLVGSVSCGGTDRFGQGRSSLTFTGQGFLLGDSLPPVEGDFTVSLWLRPSGSPPEGGSPLAFFVISSSQGSSTLQLSWDGSQRAVIASTGGSRVLSADNLASSWHHVALTRTDGTVELYVDGIAAGSFDDGLPLGPSFNIGGLPGSLFQGQLDSVVYEGRGTTREGVVDLILGDGLSVYVGPLRPDAMEDAGSDEFSLRPGEIGRATSFRIDTGSSADGGPFSLEQMLLILEDVSPSGGNGRPITDSVESIQLVAASACEPEAGGDLVGTFLVAEESSQRLLLELDIPEELVLAQESSACFFVEVTSSLQVPPGQRAFRVSIERPEDVLFLEGQRTAFSAGARRVDGYAVEGDTFFILNVVPELRLIPEATSDETIEFEGPVTQEDLHGMLVETGMAEGIRIGGVTYRAVDGTDLAGLSNASLVAEDGAGVRATLGAGVVDVASGQILFSGLDADVPVASGVRLILKADVEEPVETTAPSVLTVPIPGVPLAAVTFALIAGVVGILALVLVPWPRVETWRPALARAVSLVLCLSVLSSGCGPLLIGVGVGIGAAASGGGGGGGGGGGDAALAGVFQVQVEPADIQARGVISGAPVIVSADGPVLGPRIGIVPSP